MAEMRMVKDAVYPEVEKVRLEKNMTILELSFEAGISTKTYNMGMRGKYKMLDETKQKIADALGISIELFKEKEKQ